MAKSKSTDPVKVRRERERHDLLKEIDGEFAATANFTGMARLSPRIRAAMAAVPRHRFVPKSEASIAYVNNALPIGHGQTISQPYIVALMTALLEPQPGDIVLEVGTGSGYQAAVLSLLVKQLYAIEVIPELAAEAAERLRRLCYDNVEVRASDGAGGWPEHVPYDGIIVTAAGPTVPAALIQQLKPGGRLVVPVGGPNGQDLQIVRKREDGTIDTRSVIPVVFVPLTREAPGKPSRLQSNLERTPVMTDMLHRVIDLFPERVGIIKTLSETNARFKDLILDHFDVCRELEKSQTDDPTVKGELTRRRAYLEEELSGILSDHQRV
jgi:protein-L-isoaspartate(D-aspartate) O-methyltransferase